MISKRAPAVGWLRVGVATLARAVIATLLGLALWAAGPALLGWHPTTVMTGSMEPRLHPGDVVVARPVAVDALRPGQVLLFDDPDHAGRLRLHRYVAPGAPGTLVTRGDANAQPDSTPALQDAVHGVAVLRIPSAGLPVVWLHEGRPLRVVLVGLAVVGLLALGTLDRPLRRAPAGVGGGPEHPAVLPRKDAGTSGAAKREVRRRARHVRRLRAGAVLALLLAATGGPLLRPQGAHAAPFTQATSNPVSRLTATTPVAPTAPTCTDNADGSTVTIGWLYAGVPAYSFEVLSGTSIVARQLAPATSLQLASTGLLDLGSLYTLTVRTNLIASSTSWTATSTGSVGVRVVAVLGLLNGVRCA